MRSYIQIVISVAWLITVCDGSSRRLQDPSSSHAIQDGQHVRPPSTFVSRDEIRSVAPVKRSITTTTRHVIKTVKTGSTRPSAKSPNVHEGYLREEIPVQCTEAGYISDPNDCNKFYNCVETAHNGFKIILLSCATGTTFDPLESRCRNNGICNIETSETEDKVEPSSSVPLIETNEIATQLVPSIEPVSVEQDSFDGIESEVDSLNSFQSIKSDEDTNDIRVREVESMEEYEPLIMEQIQTRPSKSTKTRVVTTTHSSPNAWFGLVRTSSDDSPGNPFKDEETSLAIILDFSTSRLQIFSKNTPKKANHK